MDEKKTAASYNVIDVAITTSIMNEKNDLPSTKIGTDFYQLLRVGYLLLVAL